MNLNGKVALVTGGSRGIGRAICIRLAQEGAAVAINYRQNAAEAEAVLKGITAGAGRAIAIQADISDPQTVANMYRRVSDALGPVDILVNNAGVLRRGDLTDFDFSQMDGMRRTNVDGLVHCSRAVVDGMKQRGFGRIINLTSVAAHGTALSGTTFYAATKAAVSTLTRRFALELGPFGITVNAIAPGFIMTELNRDKMGAERKARALSRTPMGRFGETEDIVGAAVFLASPAAAYVTGETIRVDGGFLAAGL